MQFYSNTCMLLKCDLMLCCQYNCNLFCSIYEENVIRSNANFKNNMTNVPPVLSITWQYKKQEREK